MSEIIPFKYEEVVEQAKKKYPKDVWNRYAFKDGAMWAIEQIFKDKTRDDIFDEMEIPRITLD